MKKRVEIKKRSYKGSKITFRYVKETLVFKLLVASIVLLFVLVVVWIIIYEPRVVEEEGFGLPTLGFGGGVTDVNLNVTDYIIFNNDQSINVTLERLSGSDNLNATNITFNRDQGSCNYILGSGLESLISDGDSKNFTINSVNTTCEPSNFTNMVSVDNITAIAGIDIVIISIKNFDIDFDEYKLYRGENLTNINLSEYFECNLDELIFDGFVNQGSENISIIFNNNNLSIYPDYNWFGRGEIIINGSCRFLQAVLEDFDIIVSPNLTQINAIPNVTIYKNENLTDVFDLDDHFVCDDMGNRSYIVSLLEGSVGIDIYYNSNNIYGIYANGTNSYSDFHPVTVFCWPDTISTSFYINYTNITRPLANNPPDFNRTECDDLLWDKNIDYILNMTKCWSDDDGDSLSGYRYENRSNKNVTISVSNNTLTLSPDSNWVGAGYFYVYATDGEDEEGGRVDFTVRDPNVTTPSANATNDTTPAAPSVLAVQTPGPSNTQISGLVGSNKTFSVGNTNYTSIKWYLDDIEVQSSGTAYTTSGLEEGSYVVRVEIKRGNETVSRTWNLEIGPEIETPGRDLDLGTVIFYLIVIILVIIILLVIWIFIVEKRRKDKPIGIGFGISDGESTGKQTPANQFNISGR